MHRQLLTNIAAHPGSGDEYGDGLLKEGCAEGFSGNNGVELGIGSCACGNGRGLKRIKQEKKEPLFRDAQFRDFHNQIIVHNCITSGLRVPFHLLLPIWMSVYDSFGPAIYKNYPSFIGFNPQNCDHNIMTEPDLGRSRCRRTDGRKWRCSKSVVTNQKYCERHMHRGSQRSRKHVEAIETVLKPDKQKISDADADADADADNRVPMTSDVDNRIDVCLSTLGNEAGNSINVEIKKSSFEDPNHRIISNRKHSVVKNNVSPTSRGFGSSPKSILHCGAGKVSPNLEIKNILENKPQRCLRTDGKKWQCKRDAVPNQKYCAVHLHRGAKRVIRNSESVSNIPATFAGRARNSSRSPENSINLNTMPSSPQHVCGNNSASSTSDATTITDENISFCIAQSLHNC